MAENAQVIELGNTGGSFLIVACATIGAAYGLGEWRLKLVALLFAASLLVSVYLRSVSPHGHPPLWNDHVIHVLTVATLLWAAPRRAHEQSAAGVVTAQIWILAVLGAELLVTPMFAAEWAAWLGRLLKESEFFGRYVMLIWNGTVPQYTDHRNAIYGLVFAFQFQAFWSYVALRAWDKALKAQFKAWWPQW